ncbi:MAG: hypothetical protein HIU91_04825 [Acidobacteria bacterium]|nr:hypothetical protein [Acidobacteriota bacterium]
MGRNIDRCALTLTLLLTSLAASQQPAPSPDTSSSKPLPPIPQLLLNVERNEKLAEAAKNDYTYHEHLDIQELDKQGKLKKTTTQDAESIVIDGVHVDRIVSRDGKPLTPEEAKKEDESIDKQVAKAKERRQKRTEAGKPTAANGDDVITASRILELGTFSNPRTITYNGRPTILVDYAGDPHAKTRNPFETVVRDLVGTVWIDQQDQAIVRAQGHFLNDFKIGGGLLADIKSGTNFDFHNTKVNNEVWLPATLDSEGKIRMLLFVGFNGRFRMVMSDYKKFRATSTIIDSDRVIGPDGQPVPDAPSTPGNAPSPQPTPNPH